MAILLMVVLLGLTLSALLVPTIITQTRTTRLDTTRAMALNAAQAGIDVTQGLIRASVTGGIGVSSKLPCGPQSGIVNSPGVAAYSVVVEYFMFDPLTEPYPSSKAMKCVAGYGTFDALTGTTTPGFARFTSTGTVGAASNGSTAGRTLTATYVFHNSDLSGQGGVLQIQPSGTAAALCMDAGLAQPVAGAAVKLQACSTSTPAAAQQVFRYRTNLTLQLISSATTANPNGLCLNSAATPAVDGNAVKLSQCGPLLDRPVVPYTQQWSYNDNGQFQAAQSNSATTGTLPNLCMNVASQTANQAVVIGACGSSWVPSPSVGPGAAASPQLVNFSEFGRCLDVTAQDVSRNFLIAYPCKQNPYPGAKTWNQLFQTPAIATGQSSATGQITTYTGQSYCLTSPGTNGSWVTLQTCVVGNARQSWTVYGGDNSLSYSTKYTIVSGSLCLGLAPPDASLPLWSTVDVETCTGTQEQKWNAVPSVLDSAAKNIHEN
jgi:hypothetical protein